MLDLLNRPHADPKPTEIDSTSVETSVPHIVEETVRKIRTAPLEKLADPTWLEHEFLLSLGLNNENLQEFPTELYPYCGRGIKSWQYPKQFASYLNFLRSQKVKTYAEIGCRHGGTFVITVEYLSRFFPIERAMAVDPFHSPTMTCYAKNNPTIEYINHFSTLPPIIEKLRSQKWDLVLVDGDHSLKGVMHDYFIIRDHARIMAFHDIASSVCPGVVQFWDMIRSTTPAAFLKEFVGQYQEVHQRTGATFLGLGVMLRQDPTNLENILLYINGDARQ